MSSFPRYIRCFACGQNTMRQNISYERCENPHCKVSFCYNGGNGNEAYNEAIKVRDYQQKEQEEINFKKFYEEYWGEPYD